MASNFTWKWLSKTVLVHKSCWTDCWWCLGAVNTVSDTDLHTPLLSHEVSPCTRVVPFSSQSPAKVSCPWLSYLCTGKVSFAVSLRVHWLSGSILGIAGTLHRPCRSHRAVEPQRGGRLCHCPVAIMETKTHSAAQSGALLHRENWRCQFWGCFLLCHVSSVTSYSFYSPGFTCCCLAGLFMGIKKMSGDDSEQPWAKSVQLSV